MSPKKFSKQGFTLIELLVVIGILAILAAIVIVAINPARQLAQARNSQRWSDVNSLLNAIHQQSIDNNGVPNDSITAACGTATQTIDNASGGSGANLISLTTGGTYLTGLPIDPNPAPTAPSTGYTVCKSAANRITVAAPQAELSATITVSR
jgi:type IV pilus assembly protein PilA